MRVKLKKDVFSIIDGTTWKAGVSYVAKREEIDGAERFEVFYPGSPGSGILVSPDIIEEVIRR